jgi:hypothetical protein
MTAAFTDLISRGVEEELESYDIAVVESPHDLKLSILDRE